MTVNNEAARKVVLMRCIQENLRPGVRVEQVAAVLKSHTGVTHVQLSVVPPPETKTGRLPDPGGNGFQFACTVCEPDGRSTILISSILDAELLAS